MIVLVMAVMLMIPFSAAAVDLLGFRIGPSVMLNQKFPISADQENTEIDFGNYTFGADARFNFTLMEVNALALATPPEEGGDIWSFDTYINGGLTIDLADLVQLSASAGPKIQLLYNKADKELTAFDEDGNEIVDPEVNDLLNAGVNVRLSADVLLGGISLSGFVIADTNLNFSDASEGEGLSGMFEDQTAKIGVSALLTIF